MTVHNRPAYPVIPMKKIDIVILGLLSLMLSGCRLKRPENVLSPKKMEQFLYDYHLAQAVTQDFSKDERYTTIAYVDWAYSKNGITREQFDASLIWYTRYPKELARIYKRLSNRVDDEYKAVSKSLSQIEKKSYSIPSGDSVNLWYLDRTSLLNTSEFMNRITYRVGSDTTIYLGDTLSLNLNGTFLSIDSGVPAYAYISLSAYYNDSISTADTLLRCSGPVSLSVVLDKSKRMSAIGGSVNYIDSTDNRGSMLVLSGLELMRYHAKKAAAVTDSTAAASEL